MQTGKHCYQKRGQIVAVCDFLSPAQLEQRKKYHSELQEKYSGTLQRLAHNAREKLQQKKVSKVDKARCFLYYHLKASR